MRFGLTDAQLAEITAILQKYPEVGRGIIFGSRAMGNYKEASDIDLAIKGEDVTFKTEINISGDLEDSELPFLCDVVNYNTIDHPPFKEHIDTEGVTFYRRGWREMRLGDVASLINDKTLLSYISLTTYVSTENMVANKGGIQLAASLPQIKKVNAFKRTDTLFSNIRTYFKKVWLANFDGGSSGDVLIFRSEDKKFLSPEYLYYFLSSDYFIDLTVKTARGTKMPRGDKKTILGTTILVPELSFQNQVVAILCSLDDKIKLNNDINTTLENMADAIFKSWFVDFDPVHAKQLAREAGLPAERAAMAVISALCSPREFIENFAAMDKTLTQKLASMSSTERDTLAHTASLFPDGFEDSELGKIPRGWKVQSLSSAMNFLNGLALQKFPPENNGNDLPVLKIAQLSKGTADGGGFASNKIAEKYVVNDGDVIFSWSASLMVKIWAGGKAALNQQLFKVTSSKYEKWFQYFWCKHHLEKFTAIAKSKATTMGHIQRKHLDEANIVISDHNLINAANIIMTPLTETIASQNVTSKNLANLCDTLLPKLINGDIDVSALLE